ncbi:MAG: tRNA threonylcarbamoyladenosine biosynthesis protein RimN [Pseudomonadales bacterium]|nr:tRNA threonylcarbamoyladenosine biosynthesis protein RimN [Pseudomonadales bacterium]
MNELNRSVLDPAIKVLAEGGVVAHATEGVWGFACDANCKTAVQKILAIKQRGGEKGLIVIAGSIETFAPELESLSDEQVAAISATWPGPHTWILPNQRFDEQVTGSRTTIACRVPGHAQARALARMFGHPLISTSANRSGQPAATLEGEVRGLFAADVDWILSGAVQNAGVPSTIHQLDGEILR